ncbi:serine-threonine protein kinase 19-domain-containing protein [Scheffersomyces xylosifermentans]|uniref:serine-threonine protein kinase 19-domain-containing protein n=1 Tax=Scheffersomyces xylosifermentans TaxID=1304137 RepID=UPI00315C896F
MSSNLRYSAAKSSKIGKRALTSPVKKIQKDLKKILPSQNKYLSNLKKNAVGKIQNGSQATAGSSSSKPGEEQLLVQDYNVQLDYQLSKDDNIMVAIDTILDNQWAESTSLHSRYFTQREVQDADGNMEQLVFSLKGLSMKVKAEIMTYRRNQLPKGIVTTAQLYSIYESQGNTFVDRNLELNIRNGNLRKFIITNASPVISRTKQKYQHGKVTYGFENVEVIVKAEYYSDLIKEEVKKIEGELEEVTISNVDKKKKTLQFESLKKFLSFVTSNPTALFVTHDDLDNEELSALVSFGLVTLTSNHLNEIESHQYSISYPACGTFLKLINAGRVWLVKTLSKGKYKENLEEQLFNKWEGINMNGETKMNNFRPPFYGYDLNWILADALGAGVIEVFNTPVGRGWKLTGKI